MDMQILTQLIGSIGFPICMCLLLYRYMEKQGEQHRTEMDKITESLNNNTLAITELTARLQSQEVKE